MIHNQNFKVVEFDHFKMQAGLLQPLWNSWTYGTKKFRSLGLLPKLNVVPSDINFPIVETIREVLEEDEWKQKIDNSNVIITTMSLAVKKSYFYRTAIIQTSILSSTLPWKTVVCIRKMRKYAKYNAEPYDSRKKQVSEWTARQQT